MNNYKDEFKFYYKDGSILDYRDYNKTVHREAGPALISCYENGKTSHEGYYLEGKLHREDGPAFIGYHNNGKVAHEEYWLRGMQHRIGGPAFIIYQANDRIEREFYYLEDKKYTKEEYYQILEEIKNMDEALRLIDPRKWVRELK